MRDAVSTMNTVATIKPADGGVLPLGELMERVLAAGDISQLSPGDRAHYLVRVAESAGLNPLTRPFDLIPGQGGKLVLYANKSATDQLRRLYGLTSSLLSQETVDGVRIVTVEVSDGRRTETNIGAVPVDNLKGEALANALMKAITKAKRRTTLDWAGLGVLDETEIEGMRAAMREQGSVEATVVPPRLVDEGDPAIEGVVADRPPLPPGNVITKDDLDALRGEPEAADAADSETGELLDDPPEEVTNTDILDEIERLRGRLRWTKAKVSDRAAMHGINLNSRKGGWWMVNHLSDLVEMARRGGGTAAEDAA